MSSLTASLTNVAALLAACTVEPMPPEGEQVTSHVWHGEYQMSYSTNIDILFVIDNSPAMEPLQDRMRAGYRQIADRLSHMTGGALPNVHIGVTTTDVRDQGRLRGGTYLADEAKFFATRERNYLGNFEDAFLELADVGTGGVTRIEPIEAAQRALSAQVNPGFVREPAILAIVFLTAGDDQGSLDIAEAARGVTTLKSDPSKIVLGGAFGTCDAAGTPRLDALFERFPNRGFHTSLCAEDLGDGLQLLPQMFKQTLEGACIQQPLDLDPELPGSQHECTSWITSPDTGESIRFPECSTAQPTNCWAITDDRNQGCGDFGPRIKDLVFLPRKYPFPAMASIECLVGPANP
jgi:hypothetical protein